MAVKAQNDHQPDTRKRDKRRRIFQSLWAQIAVVAPALILVIAGFVVAYQFVGPPPPDRIVMATGSESGAYHAYGKLYAERFREEGIELVLRSTAGSSENLSLLSDPDADVPVAFMQSGIGEPADHTDLKSLGSLYYEPLWVFVRSDGKPRRLTELSGLRIAVGAEGSGTRSVALALLADNGITDATASLAALDGVTAEAALQAGDIDAAIFVTSATSPRIRALLEAPGIALMNFERADAYVRRNDYLSKVLLPKGTVDLANNLPAEDTVLLAPTATVVFSPELHPALADLLLLTMRDTHRSGGLLEKPGSFPGGNFVTYPLAPVAQRFYDEGPPFLQRYLSFWAANLIDRLKILLLPLLTLLYPLFKILPPTYSWRMRSKVNRWYKELQALDDELRANSISRADATARLDEIEASVEKVSVPAGFAASAYTLRLHIDFLRRKVEEVTRDQDDAAMVG
ncbi:TAXI family TRAP transporter solute-binding subunit [Denitrobaculum tricleocarpae]|uniref:C4-dicarboxylate ABC transporter substrate-binding protein n=1 Tax=Denitrobaculum tricleocarpae TaxID=2591009 RepID=A0A545TXR8_9PROT|nr:TAXI family TRAP transporter solute-binding subunit [Denitrobaculum tricleocarpae]TQV81997.1 C4-dicarboxylate ABC transporter substrate-binding protein [Denitrobaculum tricleocarpae]